MKIKNFGYVLCVVMAICLYAISCSTSTEPVVNDNQTQLDTLKVGVIIPLTGEGPLQKEPEKAAINIALEDVNAYLSDKQSTRRIEAVIHDSKFNSTDILNGLEYFHQNDIRIVVFSGSSSNLNNVKDYINDNDMLLINQTSTGALLALDDNIYRLIPNDQYLANVMAGAFTREGIENVVILHRGDVWGMALSEDTKSAFEASGGTVLANINYDPRYSNVELKEAIANVNNHVTAKLSSVDSSKIVVMCTSFHEGIELLRIAAAYPNLKKVKWYGSDGFVQNQDLLKDSTAAAFTSKVGFYCPIIAEPTSNEALNISERISQEIEYAPYSWALLLYDAFWTAALTRADEDYSDDIDQLKEVFFKVLDNYEAVSGNIVLNDNGDRDSYPYDFWGVAFGEDAYSWYKAFTYAAD